MHRKYKKTNTLLRRVILLLTLCCCGILLVSCEKQPDTTPTSDLEDSVPVRTLPKEYIDYVYKDERIEDTFIDAYSAFWVSKEGRMLYGVQVDGNRNDTILKGQYTHTEEVNIWDQCGFAEIHLTIADGITMTVILETGFAAMPYGFFLECIDLDGDGTDEIFVFFDFGGTGGHGDLHILKINGTELVEIGTALTEKTKGMVEKYEQTQFQELESCANIQLVETSEGFILRIYTSNHRYNTRYAEYIYRDNTWYLVLPEVSKKERNSSQEVLKRWGLWELYGFPEQGTGENIFFDEDENYWDFGLNLYGTGIKQDRLYVCRTPMFYGSSKQKWLTILEIEQGYGSGNRVLVGCFEVDLFSKNCWLWPCDIDGDGSDEVVLSFKDATTEHVETHIFKIVDGVALQVFFHSTAYASEGYRIPLQIKNSSFTDKDSWNSSVTRVWLEEFPEGISIMMAHGTEAYSRIGWDGARWVLLEQGKLEQAKL